MSKESTPVTNSGKDTLATLTQALGRVAGMPLADDPFGTRRKEDDGPAPENRKSLNAQSPRAPQPRHPHPGS